MSSAPHLARAAISSRRFGYAWIALCCGLALHVADEALTGFLSVYNPTAHIIRQRWGVPVPIFSFGPWLAGLLIAVIVLLALSPFALRGERWMRVPAFIFSIIMLLNGCTHISGTILGHSFPAVRFPRPMPGTYSSPVILILAAYLLVQTVKLPRPGSCKAGA